MGLTEEQQKIINEIVDNAPGTYAIEAVAGSGKSFTIFEAIAHIKEKEPNAKILYLVFNKANQIEAERKLRKYAVWSVPVKVKTAHSFANEKWHKTAGDYTVIDKFDWHTAIRPEFLKSYDPDIKYSKRAPIDWLLNKYENARCLLSTFIEDMYSHWEDDYDGPDKPKECELIGNKGRKSYRYGIPISIHSCVQRAHIDIFKRLYEKHEKEKMFTHGMYLKGAAYSSKSGGSQFDYVFFDEAQDASYFMLKLLEKQDIGKIYYIGDERQSIYSFGAANENVFQTMDFDKKYTLTKSFRFGHAVADLATEIINMNSKHEVFGSKQSKLGPNDTIAFLYRTNATLFREALDWSYAAKMNGEKLKIDLMKRQEDVSVYTELLGFLGLFYQYNGKAHYYRHYRHEFPEYTPASLLAFEQRLKDRELGESFMDIYNEQYDSLSEDIHVILPYALKEENFIEKYLAFKHCINEHFPEKTITMVTMHRSKGMEWDIVCIREATRLYYKDKEGTYRRHSNYIQELNLAYVAVTRARKSLDATILREELEKENCKFRYKSFLIGDGEYMKDPEMYVPETVAS